MQIQKKVAPSKFKGDIKHIPLHTITDYISFSCILNVENGNDRGSLFFDKGELVDAELNKYFDINNAKEILNWNKGTFSYQKWGNEFEIECKYLSNILHFIELGNLNSELNFNFENKTIKIFCSKGMIVKIEPQPKNLKIFFSNIVNNSSGKLKVKSKKEQTGNIKKYFSEIINNKKAVKNKNFNEQNYPSALKKENKTNLPKNINIEYLEKSFKQLQNDLGDVFLASSVFCSDTGKLIYKYKTETKQSVLFAKLHKDINDLLSKASFGKINNYYLLDLEKNYLFFVLIFKDYHFGLAFDKQKIKLGYLFNIIKPILIEDYKNAVKNK